MLPTRLRVVDEAVFSNIAQAASQGSFWMHQVSKLLQRLPGDKIDELLSELEVSLATSADGKPAVLFKYNDKRPQERSRFIESLKELGVDFANDYEGRFISVQLGEAVRRGNWHTAGSFALFAGGYIVVFTNIPD